MLSGITWRIPSIPSNQLRKSYRVIRLRPGPNAPRSATRAFRACLGTAFPPEDPHLLQGWPPFAGSSLAAWRREPKGFFRVWA
jgi:hypothetical protein